MCGIAGILKFNGQRVTAAELKRMTDTIEHRGPDGEGHWANQNGNVGFGHRRLSIIDLSEGGSQPMHYGDTRFTITFNGEIYNYIELKERLIKKGYKFHSASDTEVLLALYEDKRERCLEDLDGMFAFAIWDEKEQELFCARDRFGEKPFFYVQSSDFFAFGSEMKELWAITGKKSPNTQMVSDYIRYGYLHHPQHPEQTFYKDIKQLPPAHYIKISRTGGDQVRKYWDIDINFQDSISFESAKERFRELFTESVKRRLRSDVPVGSSLSGGLDSSLVVCLIDQLLSPQGKAVNTFSARFRNFVKDEGKFMQYVIDKTSARANFVYSESDVLNTELDRIFFHQEEPFGSASILVQYQVFQLAKEKGVTVLLDGQGADEILAGYTPYYQTYFNELRKGGSKEYRTQLDAYLQMYGNEVMPSLAIGSRFSVKDYVRRSIPGLVRTIRRIKNRGTAPSHNLHTDFFHSHNRQPVPSFIYDPNSLNSHLWTHTSQYGLSTLLRYADRNSMAHSREVRLPFLSHQLVEFLFSMPAEYKINNGWTKYLMRSAFEDTLPAEIAWRKDKIGYEPPQQEWLGKPEIVERVVEARKTLVDQQILDKKILDQTPVPSAANTVGDKSWEHIMVAKMFD